MHDNDLYARCGFDTLFLPMLLNEPAEVSSTCPVTGQPIRLTIPADGIITNVSPETVVAAIAGPAILAGGATTGPRSAVCTQMPLIVDAAARRRWAADHPGVAIIGHDHHRAPR